MRCGNLTYDPWIWWKVISMASTASNRKSAKNLLNSEFLKIHSTLRDQDWTFWCQVIGNIIFSKFFLMKWGCWGHWGHLGHWGCWGHSGCWGSWWHGNHPVIKVQAAFDFLRPKRLLRSVRPVLLSYLLRSLRPLRLSIPLKSLKSIW